MNVEREPEQVGPETPGERYLWDRTGPPDPEVERLERTLGALRYRGGPLRLRSGTPPKPGVLAVLRRRWPMALAALVLLGAAVAWLAVRPARSPASSGWDVQAEAGRFVIDAAAPGDSGRLGVGQWLETPRDARALVAVADIGRVTVHPNTRLRLLETEKTEHRLELARGKIEAFITAPPRLFFVNTPSAVAVDYGCAYTLAVDDRGRGRLEVTLGLVCLERGGRRSVVPADAVCETDPAAGPGTPCYADASDALREALRRLDFAGGGDADLDVVLREARPRDAMTLWHLMGRAPSASVAPVFERLAAISPPPEGVTLEGIRGGDAKMLGAWARDLGLVWDW